MLILSFGERKGFKIVNLWYVLRQISQTQGSSGAEEGMVWTMGCSRCGPSSYLGFQSCCSNHWGPGAFPKPPSSEHLVMERTVGMTMKGGTELQEAMLRLAMIFTNVSKIPTKMCFLFAVAGALRVLSAEQLRCLQSLYSWFSLFGPCCSTALNCIKCLISGSTVLRTCVFWQFFLQVTNGQK